MLEGLETPWWAGLLFWSPVIGGIIAAAIVFKRQTLYLDARTVENARRIAKEKVEAVKCGTQARYPLEAEMQALCGEAVAAAFLISNPNTKPKAKHYAKGCKVTISGQVAVLDLWMGPKFTFGGEGVRPVHVPIIREAAPMDIEAGRRVLEGLTRPKTPPQQAPNGQPEKQKAPPQGGRASR